MDKLTYNQKIAYRYYLAYGALCHSVGEQIEGEKAAEMKSIREQVFNMYKKYDPNNSFDVSKDYNLNAGEIIKIV